jgi:hypothetical protein
MRQRGLSGLVKHRNGKSKIRVPGIVTAPDLVAPRLRAERAEPALGR